MYKILIRPLEKKDADISWKWRNDSEIWEFTGRRPNISITPEIELNWMEKVLTEENSRRFAITVDGKYIGNIQLTNITEYDAEYHIFLGDKNYWGKGISFSATQQIIRYAKNVLKLNNIYLKVNPQNVKAIKLYEKSGFEIVSDEIKMILTLDKMVRPMVSIFCMVYNHEPFLRECLEGFLMQKCNFDYEIVVGEDCSKDESRAILLDYAQKYPGKFKLLLHQKNIGAIKNQMAVFENCTGKYIAMCEGDDYWTEPTKLQQQFDFMEQNPDYIMCCHDRNVVDENNEVLIHNQQTTKVDKDTFVQTLLYRNISFDDTFYHYFEKAKNGDTFLIYRLHQLGATHYFDFNGACYRVSDVGVWSKVSDDKRFEMSISSLDNMIEYYSLLANKSAIKEIKKWKAEQYLIRSKSLSEAGYKTSALNHVFKYNTLLLSSNPNQFFSLNNFKTTVLLNLRYLLQ